MKAVERISHLVLVFLSFYWAGKCRLGLSEIGLLSQDFVRKTIFRAHIGRSCSCSKLEDLNQKLKIDVNVIRTQSFYIVLGLEARGSNHIFPLSRMAIISNHHDQQIFWPFIFSDWSFWSTLTLLQNAFSMIIFKWLLSFCLILLKLLRILCCYFILAREFTNW